jgi:hypothetical protein
MPQYCFRCPSCKDEESGKPLEFTVFLSTVPKKVKKDTECSSCGGRAPRAMDLEIPTQAVVGLTPISKSTTTPGSLYNTVRVAFGDHDERDPSQAPFRDSGELQKFMNGANDLGKPSIDQRTGLPRKRPDGSVIHEGARLIKYDRGATPSRDGIRKRGPSKRVKLSGGEVTFQYGKGGDFR